VDPAILRPGRFDRLIYVPEPQQKARLEILKLYTKGMPLTKDVDLPRLAGMTKSYSGADIEALCREAALHALRSDFKSKQVTFADFQEAMKKIGPSVSPDMDTWYKNFFRQIRRVQKPATPVA
jgi:transitional endoplasmic reticulum ATPase